jgi:hypothetical protein
MNRFESCLINIINNYFVSVNCQGKGKTNFWMLFGETIDPIAVGRENGF